MQISDRVYGVITITEPIIIDIINSKTLQRLKGVEQSGYFEPYFPGTTFARFEHSIGVYNLLKLYDAPLEEQIAGLIHDVSHGAFSHVIDYTLKSGSESEHCHQDSIHDEFVRNSELKQIISNHGFVLDYILDDANFPLKETNLPDICADRIDYSLRQACASNFVTTDEIKEFFDNLVVKDKVWVFKDFKRAKKFTNMFKHLNRVSFSCLEAAIMQRTMGDYLKYALTKGYINEADLYTTDIKVLKKININLKNDIRLSDLFAKANNKTRITNDPNNFDVKVSCKSRAIDPWYESNSGLKRVSEEDLEWAKKLKAEMQPKEYFLKFEK